MNAEINFRSNTDALKEAAGQKRTDVPIAFATDELFTNNNHNFIGFWISIAFSHVEGFARISSEYASNKFGQSRKVMMLERAR